MKKNNQKINVLLFKVPDCEFPGEESSNNDLRVSYTYHKPLISCALAFLGAFIKKYGGDHFNVNLVDISIDCLLESENEQVITSIVKEKIKDFFNSEEYDVIGLSTMFLRNDEWTHYVAGLSLSKNPSAPIILGGGYATLEPKASLMNTNADYAVMGEGEDTFLYLLNKIFCIKNNLFNEKFPNISGYAYWENGDVKVIPKTTYIEELNLLPRPSWDEMRGKEYFSLFTEPKSMGYFPVMITRGCPYRCTFCSVSKYVGRTMRCRSPEIVLADIDYFYNKYKFKRLVFIDDDVNVNRDVYHSVLRGLIKRKYDFECNAFYVAINALCEETIKLMADVGMKRILLPVETGSPRMQKEIKKFINLEKAKKAVEWAKKYDFNVSTNFMVGFPQETMEDIQQTLDFACEIKAHQTAFWVVTPWSGTELFDFAIENNFLQDHDGPQRNKRGYRDIGHFVNVKFDYQVIKDLTYDFNIRLNFLSHSWLEEPRHYNDLLVYWQQLEAGLPKHAILFVCLGYLSKKMGKMDEAQKYYKRAVDLFKQKDVNKIYGKYLEWDEKPINDFVSFQKAICTLC